MLGPRHHATVLRDVEDLLRQGHGVEDAVYRDDPLGDAAREIDLAESLLSGHLSSGRRTGYFPDVAAATSRAAALLEVIEDGPTTSALLQYLTRFDALLVHLGDGSPSATAH